MSASTDREKQDLLQSLLEKIPKIQGFDSSILREDSFCPHEDIRPKVIAIVCCLIGDYQRVDLNSIANWKDIEIYGFEAITDAVVTTLDMAMIIFNHPKSLERKVFSDMVDNLTEVRETSSYYIDKTDQSALEKVQNVKSEFETELNKIKENAKILADEISDSFRLEMESAKEDIVAIGAEKQADFFEEQAKIHKNAARVWGVGLAFPIILFGVLAYISWVDTYVAISIIDLLQILMNRGLFFVLLGFGILFCARNYMTHRHNEVVNRHRQKALESYRALVKAGGTERSKDIILSYAAQSIYMPQDTGFMRNENPKRDQISFNTHIPGFSGEKGGD